MERNKTEVNKTQSLLQWGAWVTMTDEPRLTSDMVPFFMDVFKNVPELLEKLLDERYRKWVSALY